MLTLRNRGAMFAIASLLAAAPALVCAQPAAAQEDAAQLKADQAALAQERVQRNVDAQILKADQSEGKMAAESRDSLRIYRDRQDIRGEKADIAHDANPSLQRKADRSALKAERAKLKADQQRLQRDRKHGRMAATSPDAERLYKDQQAIRGQERAIARDEAQLRRDSLK